MKALWLEHTWPIWEQRRHFELGYVLNCAVTEMIPPASVGALNLHHAGCWECDLSDNSLIWSGGVYDLFGLPRDADVSREQAASYYCVDSRDKMESLRAYSIKHRRGFTLDVEISSALNEKRWMRLIAAPVCSGDRTIGLRGLKLAI